MATCIEHFLSGDDFHAVSAICSSYGSGANVSEVVEKTATDEKNYHK